MTGRDRGQDGHADGICYLVAPSQPPVTAVDRKQADGSCQEPREGADGCGNKQWDQEAAASSTSVSPAAGPALGVCPPGMLAALT